MSDDKKKINSRARRIELLLSNMKLDSLPYVVSSDPPPLPSEYAVWVDADDGTISLQLFNGSGYIWFAITVPFTQQQSDWDQADNTQVDYIKNKPTILEKLSVEITITAADWSANAQTILVSGLLTTDHVSFYSDEANWILYCDAEIFGDSSSAAGQIDFTCQTTPTSDIVITLDIVR